ncbi:MAG: malto-oligosyltrehalose trehalohydrolase [Planctomyces sp.]|nr:malto-oligosyltrehalose trehalohydrolase [Planctomyces sp.]
MAAAELEVRIAPGTTIADDGVAFCVWAPRRRSVSAVLETPEGPLDVPLTRQADGCFAGFLRDVRAGHRYWYRLDDDRRLYPDPRSRFQPEGPHGPSEIIDPHAFPWTDAGWRGCGLAGQVIYELHIGTFTPEGTWAAARDKLPLLADLGATLLEVMPIADFTGDFGWGYDGVNMYAPCRLYGRPDDFREFVDAAHRLGIGVLLDVVYNHFGPDGNYHQAFSRDYFTDRYRTDWGEALNFDGVNSEEVREFVIRNAVYWIDEFHLDGLRLDATQSIFDSSDEHILTALTRAAREAAGQRSIVVVAENEPQHVEHIVPAEQGGYGLDALWNDDLHHTAMVALTGHAEAYYSDYRGTPQEFLSALKWGYLFQGQRYTWQGKRRGTPTLRMPPAAFVAFLENHDQAANSGKGQRVHQVSHPGCYRALTALFLLGPATPMLFQGQEFASSAPFFYFADHRPDLARLVSQGRRDFLSQFPSLASAAMQARLPDPAERATFERSHLDWTERDRNVEAVSLHRDLIALRRSDPVISRQPADIDGAVLSSEAFLIRWFDDASGDRLLVVNLGRDLHLVPAPEPLLAEPGDCRWQMLFSSEDPQYGGLGATSVEHEGAWTLPGRSAALLAARSIEP